MLICNLNKITTRIWENNNKSVNSYRTVVLYGSLTPTICVLVLFTYLCWADGNRCCFNKSSQSDTPTAVMETMDRCSPPSQVVASSRGLRLAIFLVSVVLISTCAVITLVSPESCYFRNSTFRIYFKNYRLITIQNQ